MKTLRATAVALLFFLLGFLAHRHGVHEPVRAIVAYAKGSSGGCGLGDMLQLQYRLWKLDRSFRRSNAETKKINETADGFAHWETPLGRIWTPPRNTPNFAIGEQGGEVYTEGEMSLGPKDVVLDCGANIGDFILVCLRAGVKKVVAVEPSPVNIECIRRSFPKEIASGRVVLVPKGVWHTDAVMTMSVFENSLLDSFLMRERWENSGKPKPREVELPVTTIDKIVQELNLSEITFIKMDIEGAERNAIQGAATTIGRFRPRMALATENLEDDYLVVPQEVAKLELNYKVRCGLCRQIDRFAYKPDILFFVPQ